MRLTHCLILGLVFTMAGGCAHCDRCRTPLLKRISPRQIFQHRAVELNGCGCSQPHGRIAMAKSCDCGTALSENWSSIIQSESEHVDASVPVQSIVERSYGDYVIDAPVDNSNSPNSPIVEAPAGAVPPSINRRIQNHIDAPELKGTVVPGDSESTPVVDSNLDTGYYAPKNRSPVGGQNPEVAEIDSIEVHSTSIMEPFSDMVTGPEQVINEPFSNEWAQSEPADELQIVAEPFDSELELAPAEPKLIDESELVAPSKKIKAIPASSKRIVEPVLLDAVRPVPYGVIHEETPVEINRQMLPAQSDPEFYSSPIVLKAFPVKNHIVNDRRVADANGVDGYGLPNGDRVQFRRLPTLDGNTESDSLPYYSTSDAPFEEPPADRRVPDVEPVPQPHNRAMPLLDTKDSFTTPTSYQVPMDNDAQVLSEIASAIDCGLVDNDSPSFFRSGTILRVIPVDDFDSESSFAPARAANGLRTSSSFGSQADGYKILRMRAAPLVDHATQVPPLVSIRGTENPIIVRHIHPDAHLPIAKTVQSELLIPARPVFDNERLDSSIRGLTARPSQNANNDSNTIDR